ncbi:MAG: hypothetical protein ACOYVJ_12380 [Nitrospirota bacterium]
MTARKNPGQQGRNLFFILPIVFLFLLNACVQNKPVSVELLEPRVAFDEIDPDERLAKGCILVLPGDFGDTLPLTNEDKRLWRWFFVSGFQTIFRTVTVIETVGTAEGLPASDVDVIVQPELVSWNLGVIPQGPRDQKLWNCRMQFKLQMFDTKGIKTSSLVIDKNGWGRNRIEALTEALKGFISKSRVQFENLFL